MAEPTDPPEPTQTPPADLPAADPTPEAPPADPGEAHPVGLEPGSAAPSTSVEADQSQYFAEEEGDPPKDEGEVVELPAPTAPQQQASATSVVDPAPQPGAEPAAAQPPAPGTAAPPQQQQQAEPAPAAPPTSQAGDPPSQPQPMTREELLTSLGIAPTVPVAEPTPAPQAQPAQPAPAPGLTEAQIQQLQQQQQTQTFEQVRDQQIQQLADNHYALDEEAVELLSTEPEKVFARGLSRVFMDAVQATTQQLVQALPGLVQGLQSQQEENTRYEDVLYQFWGSRGFDLREHESDLASAGAAYRMSNPSASADEIIQQIGAQVILAKQIVPVALQGGQAGVQPPHGAPPPQPAPFQSGAAAPGVLGTQPALEGYAAVDEQLFAEEIEE